jgi:hybrid cluster-associated redox disulfide protein
MLYYFRNLKVKERKNMQISKDTVIGTILDSAPETGPFFLEMGMHCLGCPSARSETVAQDCMVHGVNADDLVSKINAFLAENK